MSLVNTNWLENNLEKVKIIDCSWHMPQTDRDGFEEYKKQHIENAIFFNLDENSKNDTDLPHMLTDKKSWEKIVRFAPTPRWHDEPSLLNKVRCTKCQDATFTQTFSYDRNVILLKVTNSAMNVLRRRGTGTRTKISALKQNRFQST